MSQSPATAATPTEVRTRSKIGLYASYALETVASLAVVAILLLVIANVVGRLFFNSPIPGTNEMVGNWFLPIIVFVGFVVAKTRREHIEATLVYDRLSRKNKLVVSIAVNIIAAAALVLLTYYTFLEAVHGTEIQAEVGVTGVPVWPILWFVPFGFGTLAAMYAVDAVTEIRRKQPPVGEHHLA